MIKAITRFCEQTFDTAKSVAKIILLSRRSRVGRADDVNRPLIIMGNGPALSGAIAGNKAEFEAADLLAVNYAAKSDEFYALRPRYYVLIDPAFFADDGSENVRKLWEDLSTRVDWRMTVYVPAGVKIPVSFSGTTVDLQRINPIGVDGYRWFRNKAFDLGLGMPRPRNVLVPSIMTAMRLGYRRIYLAGADHSWTKTLSVNDLNEVISIQPHFYKDNEEEHRRVATVYRNYRLYEIMFSFYLAFKAYFIIKEYAEKRGIAIYNSTPDSFIDAFERRPLTDITSRS